jgi:Resolvase, N terminal domain
VELGLTIARSYVDNDLSACSGVERPEYGRLLADIAADQIGTLVIWHANRLHRSTEEVNAFIKLARAHRVRLYSTTKGAFYNLKRRRAARSCAMTPARRSTSRSTGASGWRSPASGRPVKGLTAEGAGRSGGGWTPGGCGRCA